MSQEKKETCEFGCMEKFHEFLDNGNKLPPPEEILREPSQFLIEAHAEARKFTDIYVGLLGEAALEHDDPVVKDHRGRQRMVYSMDHGGL